MKRTPFVLPSFRFTVLRSEPHLSHVFGKSLSARQLQTSEEVKNEKAIAGRDVGSGVAQELRKRFLLTELCFLCDNWPKHVVPLLHTRTHTELSSPSPSLCLLGYKKKLRTVKLPKRFQPNCGLVGLECRSTVIILNSFEVICSQWEIYCTQNLHVGVIFKKKKLRGEYRCANRAATGETTFNS